MRYPALYIRDSWFRFKQLNQYAEHAKPHGGSMARVFYSVETITKDKLSNLDCPLAYITLQPQITYSRMRTHMRTLHNTQ